MKTKLPYVQDLDFCFFASYSKSRATFSSGLGIMSRCQQEITFLQPYVQWLLMILETENPYVQDTRLSGIEKPYFLMCHVDVVRQMCARRRMCVVPPCLPVPYRRPPYSLHEN